MSSTCPETGIFGHCLTRLTTGESIGLTLDLEAGLISFLAVIIFLGFVIRNVARNNRNPMSGGKGLIRTHTDIYILSLLAFELLHGSAATMTAKWLHEGQLYCSKYCTVQGAMRNIGSTGVAFMTLIIAIHTFFVIFFHWVPPKNLVFPILIVSIVWCFMVTYISFELYRSTETGKFFYTPSPYCELRYFIIAKVFFELTKTIFIGCWIGSEHASVRIWGQYLWMWLAASLSILLYIPLYFCVKGNLFYHPKSPWKVGIRRNPMPRQSYNVHQSHAERMAMSDAFCMIYYPLTYVLLVLPDSIVRFVGERWEMEGRRFPFAPHVMGSAIFALSGLVNVLLFLYTRPKLLLFRPSSSLMPLHFRIKSLRTQRSVRSFTRLGMDPMPMVFIRPPTVMSPYNLIEENSFIDMGGT